MEKGLVFGLSIGELLEIYDHDSQSWKMSGCLFTGDYAKSLGALPKSGIMQNGKQYELVNLECPIRGKGCGLLPTPNRADGDQSNKTYLRKKETWENTSCLTAYAMGKTLNLKGTEKRPVGNWILNPVFTEKMMGYPVGWTDLKDSETRLSLK